MEKYLDIALKAAQEARKVHLNYYRKIIQIQNKQDSSLVSNADQESEAVIRAIFRAETPEFAILGEEEGLENSSSGQKKGRWIFDPLDGTTNYIHGYPFFCSSLALEIEGQVSIGVVDASLFGKTYYAIQGQGAFCKTEHGIYPLNVSVAKDLASSLIATGFMTYGGSDLDHQLSIFKKLIQGTRGIRRSGAAALELCLVAEGCLDGFWEFGLQEWDTAAGSLIIKEAGGAVTNSEGKTFGLKDKAIVAATPNIHSELLSCIQAQK